VPTDDDVPVAVRATAFVGPSRVLRRPVRMVRYDALWPGERVSFGVDLVGLMYRGAPADFSPIHRAVHATCPEVGVGRWVDRWGGVVDGPADTAPAEVEARGARRRRHRPPESAQDPAKAHARSLGWRLAGGAAGLGVGGPLVLGASSDGAAGPIGAVCCLVGVSTLATAVGGRRRR
jgi:hypothetical protein